MIITKIKPAAVVFCGIFFFLLIFRWEAITFPPYWDSVLGIFHEAAWLADHHFNYHLLATEQPSYLEGGARVYFWTVYPSLQALLMTICPSPTVHFVVAHILTYFLTAGLGCCFFLICRAKLNLQASVLATVALITCPLFLAQAYALNMEVMVIFLCLLGLLQYQRGRYLWAGVCLVAAFYTKSSSCTMTMALIGSFVLVRLTQWKRLIPLVLFGLPLLMVIVQGQIEKGTFRKSPSNLGLDLLIIENLLTPWIINEKIQQWFQTVPGITIILFASMIVGGCSLLWFVLVQFSKSRKTGSLKQGIALFREGLSEKEIEVICLAFAIVFVALAIAMRVWIPRYMFTVLPFALLLLGYCLFNGKGFLGYGVFSIVLLANLVNTHGQRYQSPVRNQGYILERSLEYETDMKLNLALAEKLEEDYADRMIVTYWPHVQMLSHPRLGYVSKPLNVVAGRRPVMRWHGVKAYNELPKADRHGPQVIWVDPDNVFSSQPAFNPGKDTVIDEVTIGTRSIKIWQRAY